MSPTTRSKLWVGAAALALVVPAGLALARMVAGPSTDPSAWAGVRLGMSTQQVRERYDAPGTWSTETLPDGTLVLAHARSEADTEPRSEAGEGAEGPVSPAKSVRFEFHEGLLVAVRARVPARSASAGDRLEIVPEAVRREATTPEGDLQITIIARNCPVHRAEVEELLSTR